MSHVSYGYIKFEKIRTFGGDMLQYNNIWFLYDSLVWK